MRVIRQQLRGKELVPTPQVRNLDQLCIVFSLPSSFPLGVIRIPSLAISLIRTPGRAVCFPLNCLIDDFKVDTRFSPVESRH